MSALAMAEGLPRDGQVVTLENSDECANVAEECFKKAKHGAKIKLLRGDAIKAMKKMLKGMINIYSIEVVHKQFTNFRAYRISLINVRN